MITQQSIDEAKLQAFLGQVVTDTAAAFSAPLVLVGGTRPRTLAQNL